MSCALAQCFQWLDEASRMADVLIQVWTSSRCPGRDADQAGPAGLFVCLFIIRLLRPRQGQPECNLSTGGNRVCDSRLRRTHKHTTCTYSHCQYITTTTTTVSRAGPRKKPPPSLRQVEKRSALISPPTSNHFLTTLPAFFPFLPFFAGSAACIQPRLTSYSACIQLRLTSYPISADSLSSCANSSSSVLSQ